MLYVKNCRCNLTADAAAGCADCTGDDAGRYNDRSGENDFSNQGLILFHK